MSIFWSSIRNPFLVSVRFDALPSIVGYLERPRSSSVSIPSEPTESW